MPQRVRSPSKRRIWTYLLIPSIFIITTIYLRTAAPSTNIHPDTIPISHLSNPHAACSGPLITKRIAIIGAGSAGTSTAYYLARAAVAGEINPCINVSITLFERNGYIGGRSTTIHPYILVPDEKFLKANNLLHISSASDGSASPDETQQPRQQPALELGASVFVRVNTNLLHAATALNLTIQSADQARPSISEYGLGVWDGLSFRYLSRERDSRWLELGKLFYRYGWAPLWTQRAMKNTVTRFGRMYSPPIFPWASLTDAVAEVGLDSVTGVSGRDYLAEWGVGMGFAEDIVQAGTRVNYAQNLDEIHGVETMVCMAAEGGTMSVKGGNWQIFAEMARVSGADIQLNTTVLSLSSIDPLQNHGFRFSITSSTTSASFAKQETESFHEIVLATPLQFSAINTTNLHPSIKAHLPMPIPYVSLHVTLITTKHTPAPSFFNLTHQDQIPETILTTLSPSNQFQTQNQNQNNNNENPAAAAPKQSTKEPGFYSLSTLRTVTNPLSNEVEQVYKIFSANPITPEFLSELFGLHTKSDRPSDTRTGKDKAEGKDKDISKAFSWIYPHVWNAYPRLTPRVVFDGPGLGAVSGSVLEGNNDVGSGGIWYTSGIEGFISTMETSSLAGRNVARLMGDGWGTRESSKVGQGADDGVHVDV